MTPTLDQIELLARQPTELLLLSGGDARLHIDAHSGVNKYGCAALPDATLVAFGSSTGSTISARAFNAAQALHRRLKNQDHDSEFALYQREMQRMRSRFEQLCGQRDDGSVATIFAASGTDLHLICAQLLGSPDPAQPPLHIIMMDASETGSGVAPAVRGQHFSDNAALGGRCTAHTPLVDGYPVSVSNIALRDAQGMKRPIESIDADVRQLVDASLAIRQRVLLIMIDVSKTGLIAPSPALVAALRSRHADMVDVLVDACQFRITNATLNAYLGHGCMVALTGSKFLTGPVFSGMLQIPQPLHERLMSQRLPAALIEYTARAEWPAHWRAAQDLSEQCNWGLLLRLEAAVAELQAFRAVPEDFTDAFLLRFATAMRESITASPHFELMAETSLDRTPICAPLGWDRIPTIFPFLLLHGPGRPVSRAQTAQIYRALLLPIAAHDGSIASGQQAALRVQLGQPVLCGEQYGMPVSALRMCASSRVVVAASVDEQAADLLILQAQQALGKAEMLIRDL